MAKLTKAQSRAHLQAEELLAKDVLTLDEKAFVYENWNEAVLHDNTSAGAFFTPMSLANDFKLEVPGPRVLDICAGIGILSFCKLHFQWYDPERKPQFTCVEISPDYVRVGRKLLPEATWICAEIFDVWQDLPRDFTTAIANPPFGNIRHARQGAAVHRPRLRVQDHRHRRTPGLLRRVHRAAAFGALPLFRRVLLSARGKREIPSLRRPDRHPSGSRMRDRHHLSSRGLEARRAPHRNRLCGVFRAGEGPGRAISST